MPFIRILKGSNYCLHHRDAERDSRCLSDLPKVSYKKNQQCPRPKSVNGVPTMPCCLPSMHHHPQEVTSKTTATFPLNSPGQSLSYYCSVHSNSGQSLPWTLFTCLLLELKKKITWLLQVLIAACRIFDVCCATQDLSLLCTLS